MPKIPTYDQLGQRVKAPTTQFGVRADTQAFVGAQLATADLFKKAGNIAYEFGMKEKEENTKAAFAELKTQYNNEVNDLIRNSKATSTLEAENELKNYNKKFERNYTKKNLTPNQLKSIKTQMILHQGNKMQVGKNLAFDRGRDYNSTLHNNSLTNLSMEISKLPVGNQLREAMIQEAREIYTTAAENGETSNLGVTTFAEFEKGVKLNDYSLLASNAKTVDEINDLKSSLENETLLHSDKVNIRNQIKLNESRVLGEYVEALSMEIYQNEKDVFLDDKKYQERLNQLLKQDKIETVNAKGQAITVDLKKLSSNQLRTLVNLAENKRIKFESEELNDIRNTEIANAENMSLSEIIEREKNIDNGTYLPNIKNFNARQSIKNVYSDYKKKREVEDLATADKNTQSITTSIGLNKGIITDQTQEKIDETLNILKLTDNIKALNNFNFQIEASTKSSAIFSSTQFSSLTEQANAEKRALAEARSETDIDKQRLKFEIHNQLVAKNSKARADFIKDPVDYLEKNLNKKLSPSERISRQQTMGLFGKDIRIASDNEIKTFSATFAQQTDFNEKARVGEEFISSFGPENENLVMKNLVQRNVISKVESLMLSDPRNPNINTIMVANSPEQIERTEKGKLKLSSKEGKSLMQSVRLQLEKYSNSLIGKAYEGEIEAGFKTAANNHLADTESIVYNTAAFLVQNGKASQNNAAEMAYKMTLGNSHDFFEINNKFVRVEKGSGINTEGVKGVLKYILNDKNSMMQGIISPGQQGIQGDVTTSEYVDRISSEGSWRTTVDNQSVYLIDNTGNMVRRKVVPQPSDVGGVGSLIDQTSPFVVIKLDSLNAIAKEVSDIEEDVGPGAFVVKGKRIDEFLKTRTRF